MAEEVKRDAPGNLTLTMVMDKDLVASFREPAAADFRSVENYIRVRILRALEPNGHGRISFIEDLPIRQVKQSQEAQETKHPHPRPTKITRRKVRRHVKKIKGRICAQVIDKNNKKYCSVGRHKLKATHKNFFLNKNTSTGLTSVCRRHYYEKHPTSGQKGASS